MDSSFTRSKPDVYIFLSRHLTERVYAVFPKSADNLLASLQVDATKIDAIELSFLEKTSYWLPPSAFKLKEATSKTFLCKTEPFFNLRLLTSLVPRNVNVSCCRNTFHLFFKVSPSITSVVDDKSTCMEH